MRNKLEVPYLICAALCFTLVVVQVSRGSVVSTGNFNEDFYITFTPDHAYTSPDGHSRTIKLDKWSGSGFGSNKRFIFGQYVMKIKLVPGYSAGVVVAYYLQSWDKNTRDEIDFEFLGNVTGEPWILQTNIFINGQGNREEKIYLWFDPTKDFHTYTIHWNINQLVVMVDSKPIRVFKNHSDHKGVLYPSNRPMQLLASIWNGSDWATRGGQDKLDLAYAPFVASFENYQIDACVWNGQDSSVCREVSDANWWNKDEFKSLSSSQRDQFGWVRKNYLLYDYCLDTPRLIKLHGSIPLECTLPKF